MLSVDACARAVDAFGEFAIVNILDRCAEVPRIELQHTAMDVENLGVRTFADADAHSQAIVVVAVVIRKWLFISHVS